MGLSEMEQTEKQETFGGGEIPKWVRGLSPIGIAIWAMDNWTDIKKGISDASKIKF